MEKSKELKDTTLKEHKVSIVEATQSEKELFRNVFNMYQNELSEYMDEYQSVDANGYYAYDTVEVYFKDNKAVIPYVVKYKDKVVGIIVLSKPPFVKEGCDYCIQEFFLLGYYRGKGIAKECCEQLFKRYPGHYCFLVLEKNARALSFWRKLCDKKDPNYKEEGNGEIIFEACF